MIKKIFFLCLCFFMFASNFVLGFESKSQSDCIALNSFFQDDYLKVYDAFQKNGIDLAEIFNPKTTFFLPEYLYQIKSILRDTGISEQKIRSFFIRLKIIQDMNLSAADKKNIEQKIAEIEMELERLEITPQELIDFLVARDEEQIMDAKNIDFLMIYGAAEIFIPRNAVDLFEKNLKAKGCRSFIIAGGIGRATEGLYRQVGEEILGFVEKKTGKRRYDDFAKSNFFVRCVLKSNVKEEDRKYFEGAVDKSYTDDDYPEYYILKGNVLPAGISRKYDVEIMSNKQIIRQHVSEGDIYLELILRELEKRGYTRDEILIIDEKSVNVPVNISRMNRILDGGEKGLVIFFDPLSAHTGHNVLFAKNILQKAGVFDRFGNYSGVLMQWALVQRRTNATFLRHFTQNNPDRIFN